MNNPEKPSGKRTLRDWYADTTYSVGKAFSHVVDYFEWMFHRFVEGFGKVLASIGALFFPRRLVDVLRRRRAVRASERAETLEQRGAARFIETLEYFFHQVVAGTSTVFNGIYRLFVPAKLIESTEATVKHKAIDFFWDVRDGFEKLVKRLSPPWLIRRLRWISDALAALGSFFFAWQRSRDYKKLAWSTPAMLFSVPLVAAMVLSPIYSSVDKIQHYQLALNAAIDENDDDARDLYLSKLAQLGYWQMERAEFQAALALADEEKSEEAYARMLAIAPVAKPGYPPAHAWIAGALVEGFIKEEDRWQLIEIHAKHALAEDAKNPFAMRFLADVDLQKGNTDDAIAKMEEITRTFPDLHAELMHLTRLKGDFVAAQKHASRAIATFEKLENAENGLRELTALGFLRWAGAHELLGHRDETIKTLELGLGQFPQDSMLRSRLAQMLSSQVARLNTSDPNAKRLLKLTLEVDRLSRPALLVLARGLFSNDEAATTIIAEFKEQDLLPPDFFLLAGDLSMNAGQPDRAIAFYQEACAVDPNTARGWNNIAWIWSNIEPFKLDQALEAAHRSVAADPDPRYIETRGQVYFKLGRWQEAAEDLERALNGSLPDSGPTHRTLAQVYEKLGDVEQASAHSRLLRETE